MRLAPVLQWAYRQRRTVIALRAANETLRLAVARRELTNSVLSRELEQTRRDAELLALMSRDRKVALAFVRDRHAIDLLEETS